MVYISRFFPQMTVINNILKTFFICMGTHYIAFRILNNNDIFKRKIILVIFINIFTASICNIIRYKINYLVYAIFLIFLLSYLYAFISKKSLGFSIVINLISISITYVIYLISIIISFVPNEIFNINNNYINFCIIIFFSIILINRFFKIRKFKDGFTFLINKFDNQYYDILILNISVSILFSFIVITSFNDKLLTQLLFLLIIFSIIMIITIQKTLTMYYKHKLLVNELNETKEELENSKKEIVKLEQENLNFSKVSHSIAHKQKSLEHKLNELMMKNEISTEMDISNRLKEISDEYSNSKPITEISKTGVEQIDDMFKYMQSECIKNKIEFELQLNGDIYHMINNYVSKDKLEILIADHIKNAIIAINHTENINRSILVRLGLIDGCYSLYVYDSGIEFEIDTLVNMGTKPITTHSSEGGTGMGFLNTLDTLKEYNASMIIKEIASPCKDNYTKALIIKFDKQSKFEIKSYRANKIKENEIKGIFKEIS